MSLKPIIQTPVCTESVTAKTVDGEATFDVHFKRVTVDQQRDWLEKISAWEAIRPPTASDLKDLSADDQTALLEDFTEKTSKAESERRELVLSLLIWSEMFGKDGEASAEEQLAEMDAYLYALHLNAAISAVINAGVVRAKNSVKPGKSGSIMDDQKASQSNKTEES